MAPKGECGSFGATHRVLSRILYSRCCVSYRHNSDIHAQRACTLSRAQAARVVQGHAPPGKFWFKMLRNAFSFILRAQSERPTSQGY